jgi:hypothetical protein
MTQKKKLGTEQSSREFTYSNRRKFVGAVVGMTNPLRVYGRRIFWTPVTRKHGSTLGTSFLA